MKKLLFFTTFLIASIFSFAKDRTRKVDSIKKNDLPSNPLKNASITNELRKRGILKKEGAGGGSICVGRT